MKERKGRGKTGYQGSPRRSKDSLHYIRGNHTHTFFANLESTPKIEGADDDGDQRDDKNTKSQGNAAAAVVVLRSHCTRVF